MIARPFWKGRRRSAAQRRPESRHVVPGLLRVRDAVAVLRHPHCLALSRGGSDQDGPMRYQPCETGWRIVGPWRAPTSGPAPTPRPPPHLILIGHLPKLARLIGPGRHPERIPSGADHAIAR